MGEFKNFPKTETRQLIDFNRFLELTGNKLFICLDQGIMEILRYFLNSRAGWKSTYYTELSQYGYTTPTNEQMEFLAERIAEANIDMSTCDDLNTSLQAIVAAIQGLSGSGSGSCGCVGSPDGTVTGWNDAPNTAIPGTSDPLPPGFDTREQYDTYRCDAANWIVDRYIQTLRNWAGLFGTVGGLTIAVITGLALLTIPPVGLSIILAALGILVGLDIGLLAALSSIADELETQKPTFICNIYNAVDTANARQALEDAANNAVTAVSPTPSAPFYDIVANLISNEVMENLFTYNAEIDGYGGDCSSCASEVWTDGTLPNDATILGGGYNDSFVELESAVNNISGFNVQSMDVITVDHPANHRIRITGIVAGSGNWKLRFSISGVDQGETTGANWNDLLSFDQVCSYLIVFSTDASPGSPFEITLDFTP